MSKLIVYNGVKIKKENSAFMSLYFDDIIVYLVLGTIAFIIPGSLTIWNIYNLCAKKTKKEKLASCLTIFLGGIFYMLLYNIEFEPSGDWYETINTMQIHYSLSSQYELSIIIPVFIGFIGLLILILFDSDKLPPLVSAFSIGGVVLLNILQIIFAIQIGKNVSELALMLYVYHINIFILSVASIRKHLKQQVRLLAEKINNKESCSLKMWQLYRRINRISQYTVLVFICFFFLIAILEIIFIIMGQGADAPIKAFTDTADWTFSKQIPPPPVEYEGHYLCTVAAGGHKKIVKPLRYGTRYGQTIVVNRQLCIANAFEDYIHEKLPTIHKYVRGFYDKYGYPISKHITTPHRADIVYIAMKPLEWGFLVFLYLFDVRPELRISRQYLYRENKNMR